MLTELCTKLLLHCKLFIQNLLANIRRQNTRSRKKSGVEFLCQLSETYNYAVTEQIGIMTL